MATIDYAVCISGERVNDSFKHLIKQLLIAHKPTKVIFGDCDGVDQSAKEVCDENKIPYQVFEADWNLHKRAAGPIRNKQMLDTKPNLLLAFHSNIKISKGTKDTIKQAKKLKIPTEFYNTT